MKSVNKYFDLAVSIWNKFWFSPKDLRPLAAMRILMCGTLLYTYIIRGLFNMNYFNGHWMVPREQALDLLQEMTRPPFAWFFWPDSWAGQVHFIFVVLLLLITLGLAVRPIIFLTWILHIGFLHRNYAVVYGADLIGSVFLLYLSGTQCCDAWTLKTRLFKWKEKITSNDLLNSVAYRVIQIQIMIIYAFTGFEKLKGTSWWDGTALWSVFGNTQIVIFDMSFMRRFPLFIAVLTFTTILYEIYWPAAVLTKARKPWLVIGVVFHIGICLLMNIWAFSFVMLATYFLFLNFDKDLKFAEPARLFLRRLKR